MRRISKEAAQLSTEFFTELCNRFIYCKKVLLSCLTQDQVTNCNTWFERVLMVMEEKMMLMCEDMTTYEYTTIREHFKEYIHDMMTEWNKIRSSMSEPIRERGACPACKEPYKDSNIGFHVNPYR